jgi:hypothetical protein
MNNLFLNTFEYLQPKTRDPAAKTQTGLPQQAPRSPVENFDQDKHQERSAMPLSISQTGAAWARVR